MRIIPPPPWWLYRWQVDRAAARASVPMHLRRRGLRWDLAVYGLLGLALGAMWVTAAALLVIK